MNKHYKLIRSYPGSPPIGTKAFPKESLIMYSLSGNGYNGQSLNSCMVENQQEHWKLIDEKQYEVLSFIDNNSSVSHLNNDGFYSELGSNTSYTLQIMLDDLFEKIYSIKRLSDGEIFTVGDKITGKSKYNCVITSIELNPDCPQILFNKLDEGIDLINAKHIKQPLFTTEDGVDVLENEDKQLYCVTINVPLLEEIDDLWKVESCNFKNTKRKQLTANFFKFESQKYFSNKVLADEYIIKNKPCLSFNDVYEEWYMTLRNINMDNIMKLIKSKL